METIEELKKWDLTEKDFSTLNDALEKLRPNPPSELAMQLFLSSLPPVPGLSKHDLEQKLKKELEARENIRNSQGEEIKILQVKLIMIKRFMQENNLLKEINNILNQEGRTKT